jgi:hypothetical protein
MIAITDPHLGAALASFSAMRVNMPLSRTVLPIPETPAPHILPPQQVQPGVQPEQLPVEVQGPVVATGQTVSTSGSPGGLPVELTGIVDPVTGVTYSGYLTGDAQTLYQSGSLLTGGNKLTPQGSALAAQGDLISGTPAPSAAQIAQGSASAAAPSSGFSFSSITNWLSEETLFAGYPNGLVAAAAVIAASWLLGGKKGRRR